MKSTNKFIFLDNETSYLLVETQSSISYKDFVQAFRDLENEYAEKDYYGYGRFYEELGKRTKSKIQEIDLVNGNYF